MTPNSSASPTLNLSPRSDSFQFLNLQMNLCHATLQIPCYDRKSKTTRPTSTPLYRTTPRTSAKKTLVSTYPLSIRHLDLSGILDMCVTEHISHLRVTLGALVP